MLFSYHNSYSDTTEYILAYLLFYVNNVFLFASILLHSAFSSAIFKKTAYPVKSMIFYYSGKATRGGCKPAAEEKHGRFKRPGTLRG
jgi:hypothetical protein